MVSARYTTIVAAVTAGAILLALYAPLATPTPGGSSPVLSNGSCKAPEGYTTVIADHSGFNGSVAHGAPKNPWPVITVHRGDTVKLLFCNVERVEAHGFAIDGYFDGGVTLRPGQTYSITFIADKAGSFAIFCNVFCTIHIYMKGMLVVTA
ncbi:MAG: hypothetical protein HYZ12_05650 [Thaumarchaeota archaeon]|nr:hypothetical protein [Nitrososphaerota archaeon]